MRGSLKRIAENHWKITYDLKSSNGKRKQRVVRFHGNKRAAENKLAELVAQARDGYTGTNQTLRTYLRAWIDGRTVSDNTRHRYETQFGYVEARLGDLRLVDITPVHLQRLYAELLKSGAKRAKQTRGLKASSVYTCHAFLKTALGDAARMGMIPYNPTDRVRPPRGEQSLPRVLEPYECAAILHAADRTEWHLLVLLALITGCRLGELLGLEVGDFDLKNGVLRVARSVKRDGGTKLPKNGRPRIIPLPSVIPEQKILGDTLAVLQERGQARLFPELAANICSTSARFRSWCVTHGFKGVHFHTFRHTVGSLLMAKGVHPKAIQQLLGHHTVAYTMQVYSHLMPGAFAETTKPLADLVRDQSVITGEIETEKTR